jgi:putative Ca2+/H+ antiporter (TMEM165/GDT1 family)
MVIGYERRPVENRMEAFLVSTGIVALAEIGDKTQLLALILAARYRQPLPVVLGILVATLANHGLAAGFGAWITTFVSGDSLRYILGASFIAMGAWTLIPDKLDDGETKLPRLGVFGATLVAFFLVEIGDKTQIATVALAAKYAATFAVVLGTTMGMMLANVPAVYLGEKILTRVPLKLVRTVAAAVFVAIGVLVLLNVHGGNTRLH